MRKTIARLIVLIAVIVTAAQVGAINYFRQHYPGMQARGVTWYMDGIVINHLQWNKSVTFNTVFLKANPLQMLIKGPSFLLIKKAQIDLSRFSLDQPFDIPDLPLRIEKIKLSIPYQGQSYIFKGRLKTFDPGHHQITFNSIQDMLQMEFAVDMTVEGRSITGFDLDFQDFGWDRPEMQVRRGGGWLSFTQKDGQWQASGEVEAGLFRYADRVFLQPIVTVTDHALLFTAMDKATGKKMQIETGSLRPSDLQARLLAWAHSAAAPVVQ